MGEIIKKFNEYIKESKSNTFKLNEALIEDLIDSSELFLNRFKIEFNSDEQYNITYDITENGAFAGSIHFEPSANYVDLEKYEKVYGKKALSGEYYTLLGFNIHNKYRTYAGKLIEEFIERILENNQIEGFVFDEFTDSGEEIEKYITVIFDKMVTSNKYVSKYVYYDDFLDQMTYRYVITK